MTRGRDAVGVLRPRLDLGDGKDGWRLKGHAEDAFYRWLASWGMSVRKPSDLGYEDDGYILPPLTIGRRSSSRTTSPRGSSSSAD
jgi:hypothetical protein